MEPKFKVDDIDTNIIELLTSGKSNKEISSTINIPRSTIQRRIRNLITRGLISTNFQIRYEDLGISSGLITIFVGNGDIHEIAKKVCDLEGITSIEIHIGNFDIIGHILYEDRSELLSIISEIKKIKGVKGIRWSERIYQITKTQKLKVHRNDIIEQYRMFLQEFKK